MSAHAQANQKIVNSIINNGIGGTSLQDMIDNVKKTYKSSWYIVQMIMLKIQDLSDELQNSYILANKDLSNIDEWLNKIKNDINNLLKDGSNPDLAKQLAKDINSYRKAVQQYKADKEKYGSTCKAAWSGISNKDLDNLLDMFKKQPDASGDNLNIGQLIHNILYGTPEQQQDATNSLNITLGKWCTAHGTDPNGKTDILSQWLNGGNAQTPTSYGATAVITELDGANAQNTDQINKFGTIIQTEYQAAQGVLGQLQALGAAIMQNQQQQTGG